MLNMRIFQRNSAMKAHADIVGVYLANASAIARGAGLRLAVDAQVGWAFEANTVDPSRPV